MKQNYITDPFKSYHEQHTLPISPQNFDPLDKSRDHYPQKKPIFPTTTLNKPKTLFEAISEVENPSSKTEDSSEENDLKKMLSREMSAQLEGIKNEILEGFTALLKGSLNPSKVSSKEVQEMKRQMISNKNKFEEIQDQVSHVNQQYNELNSHYVKEIQSLKASNTFSNVSRDETSIFEEGIQSQIEFQLQSFKQDLLSEVHSTLNAKERSRREGDVVDELNQIRYNFEDDLKQNFDVINGRVKKAEENLSDLKRKQRDYMDRVREDSLASIDRQNRTITQGINQVSNLAKSKYEQTQAKVVVNGEINRHTENYRAEVGAVKKSIMINQEEIEETSRSVNRRLEDLDGSIKRQFFDLPSYSKKSEGPAQKQDLVERRIQKLSGDSEGYQRTIMQLRSQLEQVTKTHKVLQAQAATKTSQEIISRLENKIEGLQNQIREIEQQARRQQLQQQQQQSLRTVSSQVLKTPRDKYKEMSRLDMSQSMVSDDGSSIWLTPKSHRGDFKSLFESEMSGQKEQKESRNVVYQGNEEKLRLPDFNGEQMKYNGDPKVKSIIDEFHLKKSRTEQKKNTGERPRQLDSISDLNTFKDPRRSHYIPSSTSCKSHREFQEINTSPIRNQKTSKYFETGDDVNVNKMKSKGEKEVVQRPQMVKKASLEVNNVKKMKHAKILAQINYFIYGTVSNLVDEEEDSEIYCNLDDDGYIFDEDGDFVLDNRGNRVKLTPEQIEKFNNNNMIE